MSQHLEVYDIILIPSAYEGTATSGAVSLEGIYDSDRDTYLNQLITPSLVTNGSTQSCA